MMPGVTHRARLMVMAFVVGATALAFGACGAALKAPIPTPVARALTSGEVIGGVARASTGTPQAGVRTLQSVSCQNGLLTVRTNVDNITATDDCAAPILQATVDQLLGVPITVTYTGDHLVIENAGRGIKLNLPGKNAMVGAIFGAP